MAKTKARSVASLRNQVFKSCRKPIKFWKRQSRELTCYSRRLIAFQFFKFPAIFKSFFYCFFGFQRASFIVLEIPKKVLGKYAIGSRAIDNKTLSNVRRAWEQKKVNGHVSGRFTKTSSNRKTCTNKKIMIVCGFRHKHDFIIRKQ